MLMHINSVCNYMTRRCIRFRRKCSRMGRRTPCSPKRCRKYSRRCAKYTTTRKPCSRTCKLQRPSQARAYGRREGESVLRLIRDPARLNFLLPRFAASSRKTLGEAIRNGRAAEVGHHLGMMDSLHAYGLPMHLGLGPQWMPSSLT